MPTAVGTTYSVFGTAMTSLSVTPTATGNALVFSFFVNTGTGVTASAVSGGGVPATGSGAWARVGSPYTDTSFGAGWETWIGTVAAAGATTITVTWSGSVAGANTALYAQEFYGFGPQTLWSGDVSAGRSNTSSSTVTCPTLAPTTGAPELYFAYLYHDSTASAGATSGYTYAVNLASGSVCWNGNITASTAPTWTQSPAGASAGIAALIRATPLPVAAQPYTARRRAANF